MDNSQIMIGILTLISAIGVGWFLIVPLYKWAFRTRLKNKIVLSKTLVHDRARQLLVELDRFTFPGKDSRSQFTIRISMAKVEYGEYLEEHDLKPDVWILTEGGEEFGIEVQVAEPLDQGQARKYDEIPIEAVKIDLQDFHRTFMEMAFTDPDYLDRELIKVLTEPNNYEWVIYDGDLDMAIAKLKEESGVAEVSKPGDGEGW